MGEGGAWGRQRDLAGAAVRKPADVATIYNFPGVITSRPLERVRDDDGRWVGGSPEQWIEELTGAVLEYGASGFILFPRGDESFEVVLKRWSQEVVPAIRTAIGQAAG